MQNGTGIQRQELLRTALWQDAGLWRLWCWCLVCAARKTRTVLLNNVPVRLAAGQLAAPLEVICTQTGLGPDVVRKSLVIGKNAGVFKVRATPWGLRITIVNWQETLRRTPALFL